MNSTHDLYRDCFLRMGRLEGIRASLPTEPMSFKRLITITRIMRQNGWLDSAIDEPTFHLTAEEAKALWTELAGSAGFGPYPPAHEGATFPTVASLDGVLLAGWRLHVGATI